MTRKVRILLYILFVVNVAAITFAVISTNRARLLETVLEETQRDSAQLIVDLEEKLEQRLAELKIAEATIADFRQQSGNTVPGSL